MRQRVFYCPEIWQGEPMEQQKLIDIDTLCARYSFRKCTIRSYCSQKRIPHIKVGKKVLFSPEAVEKWLEEHTQPVEEVRGV
jgi:excisionase family DNA binding protein